MVLQGCPSLASQVAGLATPWRSTFPPLQDLISLWRSIHSLTKIGRTAKSFCSSEMDLHAGENGFAGEVATRLASLQEERLASCQKRSADCYVGRRGR